MEYITAASVASRQRMANISPVLEYQVDMVSMGIGRVIKASSNSWVEATTLPAGSINPLMPVLAALIRARRFSTARNIAMEKC